MLSEEPSMIPLWGLREPSAPLPLAADSMSEQRLAVGGGNTRASAPRPGRRIGAKRGLDGGGDELRGLSVDGDVAAE